MVTSRVESVSIASEVSSKSSRVRPTRSEEFPMSCGCFASTFGFGFFDHS